MKVIRFRRLNKTHWEIAFNEAHLREKLNGEQAEVIMPAKPWFVRLWRRFFPLKCIEMTCGKAPNDPKLSDGGGWRGLCRWAERWRRSAAQAVTAVAVRCSAWLGVSGYWN